MTRRIRPSFFFLSLFLLATSIPGCGTFELIPAASNTNDMEEEQVTITMLTAKEADEWCSKSGLKGKEDDLFPLRDKNVLKMHSFVDPASAAIVAQAATMAVEYIKKELNSEIERYERQFTKTIYKDSFDVDANNVFVGFKVNRKTKNADDAFELICAFRPATIKGVADGKPTEHTVLMIQPVFLQLKSAKAKAPFWEDDPTFTVRVNINISSLVLKDKTLSESTMISDWEYTGYKLKCRPKLPDNLKDHRSGWMLMPQGPFKLTVAVTERDESRARQYLEKASKLIDDKSGQLITPTGN